MPYVCGCTFIFSIIFEFSIHILFCSLSLFFACVIFFLCLVAQTQTFIAFMEKVDAAIDESFFLMDFVALNLFMLDCQRLNKVIVMQLYEIRQFVTDYFKALNQKENRR